MTLPPAFFVGANLPWIRYGGDFGANAWAPAGLSQHSEPDRIASLFETLRAHGITTIRWFFLCDGRAGVRFGADGFPDGLDDVVFRDVDTALSWAERAGLGVLPVLLDFHWCMPARMVNGVQLGGRRLVLSRPSGRKRLIETVIAPLLERYGRDSRVHGWDLDQRTGVGDVRCRHLACAPKHPATGDEGLYPGRGGLRARARRAAGHRRLREHPMACDW